LGLREEKMKTTGLAFKVGIFVFIGLIALGYLTVKVTKYKKLLFMKGYEISALFKDVAGLKPNNAILMAGVEIGRVKKIKLTPEGKAEVVMLIKPEVKIRADAMASIRGYGVVGTKYVEIIQGKSKEYLKPHQIIVNTKPVVSVDETVSKVDPILEKLNTTIEQINNYLLTETNTLKEITENIKEITKNVAAISKKINTGQGTIGKLVNDETIYQNLNATVERLNGLIAKIDRGEGSLGKLMKDESLYEELKKTLDNINVILADVRAGKGTLGRLLKDDSLYLQTAKIIGEINTLVKDIKGGKGTLGKLLTDESLYEEAKETLRNIRETSDVVREATPLSVISTAVGVAK